jgi:cellulose biosynthesis protein BcsQ
MKVFACTSIKGGVGKTATAVNLAYESSRSGERTLIWDLDPQGASSYYFRVKPREKKSGRALARSEVELDELVRRTELENLDIVPADISLCVLERALAKSSEPERWMRDALDTLGEEYAHVFLDCAPGLTLVAENVYEASDALLTPTIPTPLALRALAQLVRFLHAREGRRYRVLPFFALVDRRRSLHSDTCDWVHAQPMNFLRTEIPYSSVIEQMGVRRAPVACFSPLDGPAQAYSALWREVGERLEQQPAAKETLPTEPGKLVKAQIENWKQARAEARSPGSIDYFAAPRKWRVRSAR